LTVGNLCGFKGKGHGGLGTAGITNSNWAEMAEWIFAALIMEALVAIPMSVLGAGTLYAGVGGSGSCKAAGNKKREVQG